MDDIFMQATLQGLTIIFSVAALCISCYTLYMVLRHG